MPAPGIAIEPLGGRERHADAARAQRLALAPHRGGVERRIVPDDAIGRFRRARGDVAFLHVGDDVLRVTLERIAEAAAMMTDTKVTRKVIGTAAPRHYNRALAETLQANIDKVGVPRWTDDEQTFAKAVQRLTDGPQVGLRTEARALAPPRVVTHEEIAAISMRTTAAAMTVRRLPNARRGRAGSAELDAER